MNKTPDEEGMKLGLKNTLILSYILEESQHGVNLVVGIMKVLL